MERTKQEALLIENEQWSSTEVPQDFQDIIGRISAVAGAKDVDKKFMTETFFLAVDGSVAQSSGAVKNQSEPTKFLHIGDQSYFVVGCSLLITKMMEDYIKCMIKLDGMTVDIMQKMIELLKVNNMQSMYDLKTFWLSLTFICIQLFNSRVCQVILGAGAMRSAGLKNISARHLGKFESLKGLLGFNASTNHVLALASQSVGIMITLIPLLRECVRRCMAEKQVVLLSEFDRMLKDYQNHQGEIHTKLIAIMNERFDVHMKTMQVRVLCLDLV
jgi:vacuolar protein sorting-associated protein 54